MRKIDIQQKLKAACPSLPTQRLLTLGLCAIFCTLFFVAVAVTDSAPFSPARAAYFGGMVEHVLAALALLSAGSFLLEKVVRSLHSDEES